MVIYLVDFDDIIDTFDPFSAGEKERIRLHPYGYQSTAILKEKELGEEEKTKILDILSKQIAVKTHHGGAFCHFPIHGIRAYSGENTILESTFCWVCGNFGFYYPSGTQWLDTSKEMKAIFNEVLLIPESEVERFRKKYPSALKTKENKTGDDNSE